MGDGFKSGAGSLDFEGSESDEENESDGDTESASEFTPEQETTTTEPPETNGTAEGSQQDEVSTTPTESVSNKYPYFVRRGSVGDERSTRIELHVRDEVAEYEGKFLSELADELDTDRVAKTDAREFALKLAHERPEAVARLMREEGYGELG